jgi:hypothetical protein
MNQFRQKYTYIWKCHEETSYIAILNKERCHFFSFTKSEKRRVMQVMPVGFDTSGRGEKVKRRLEGEFGTNILDTCM